MCGDCLITRASNFLIITGSIAMIFVIIILIMIIGLLRRVRTGILKVEQFSANLQSLGNVPLQLLDRRFQTKEKQQ